MVALQRVSEDSRSIEWAQLAFDTASARRDDLMQAEAAELGARLAEDDLERAVWLRQHARVVWWHLGLAAEARSLLADAHRLSPCQVDSMVQEADGFLEAGDAENARRIVEEGLAVIDEAQSAGLLLRRARIALDGAELGKASTALEKARDLIGDDATLWHELCQLAEMAGLGDMALGAAKRAYGLDPQYEPGYVAALEGSAAWETLVQVLEARGDALVVEGDKEAAAERYERASETARKRIEDLPRCLHLLQTAVKMAPSVENMRATFALARELERLPVLAALGGLLLKRLEANDPARAPIMHDYVRALDHLHQDVEIREPLQELTQLGQANGFEKRILARLLLDEDATAAAALFSEAAKLLEGDERAAALLESATTYHGADDVERTRAVLMRAIDAGADGVEAHRLAVDVLDGSAQISSISRLLELEGDVGLDAPRRAELRQTLAVACLEMGDANRAQELLTAAADLARLDGWADAMEQALRALQRPTALAKLFLDECQRDDAAWDDAAAVERVREAAQAYRDTGDTLGELRGLQMLTRLVPDDVEAQDRLVEVAASLGDKDQFLTHVNQECEAALTPQARADMALRYAPILDERFEDPEAAVELLQKSFDEAPTRALAEALADGLVKLDQPQNAADVLSKQAAALEGDDRIVVLLNAAGIAKGPADDEEKAYALYRQVVDQDASVGEARDFCLQVAARRKNWTDAVDILELSAFAATEPSIKYAQLIRAADLARDNLDDTDREVKLLEGAVDAAPSQPVGVTRLLEHLVDRQVIDGALGLVLGGYVSEERELELGTKVLEILRTDGRDAEVDELMEFIGARHPDSMVATQARLKHARAEGDDAGVLHEAQRLLSDPNELDEATRHPLMAEAGRAALAIGNKEEALELLMDALDAPTIDVELLMIAGDLADEARDEERIAKVIEIAGAYGEQVEARADQTEGGDRIRWLVLLGRAHEGSGNDDQALVAYGKAVQYSAATLPMTAAEGLVRLYEKRSDWQSLVSVYGRMAEAATMDEERAAILYRTGVIWRDRLVDEEQAGDAFARSLEANPDSAEAQAAYGMMLFSRNQFDRALPLLEKFVNPDDAGVPIEQVAALGECLMHTQDIERALHVTGRVLERDPSRTHLYASRAEMFEAGERYSEAESEWKRYLEALGAGTPPDQIVHVHRRLAHAALHRNDSVAAIDHLEEAHRLEPARMEVVVALRELYETAERWSDVAGMRIREAQAATDSGERGEQYKILAGLYLVRLGDDAKAASMLENAVENTPGDVGLLRQLLDIYERQDNRRQFLVVGERMLALAEDQDLDAPFFASMARAYHEVADDPDRAKEFFQKAIEHAPNDGELRSSYAEFAKTRGDYRTYVEVEESAIELMEGVDEKVGRRMELAEIYLQQLGDLQGAAGTLFKARDLRPDDTEILRTLADTYALDANFYPQASELYREILAVDPLDSHILRILSRLAGQTGDNDRAYGYYAALLTLQPSDDEAKRFVEACRPAIPAGPQRPLTDADRVQGLIHPDQSGPLEELFAPLARFAELTQPGDLAKLGVADSDQLGPTDARVQWMRQVLEPLGLPQVAFYVWRGGGFGCRAELGGAPILLIGSTLASDATDRQRTFLVARSGELYRTGHALCETLGAMELGGLAAAICLAVRPDATPPKATIDTPIWANTVAAPMTEAIRSSMVPKIDAFLMVADETDVSSWKWGCLATAGRIAMLLSCDVEEAVNAVLRVRGFDDVSDDQRVMVIRESPEALDLMRFAISESYFQLRQALGLALRRTK
ncbi:MAG: hypothetical protein V3T05_00830 [Myxococcota bacterium]